MQKLQETLRWAAVARAFFRVDAVSLVRFLQPFGVNCAMDKSVGVSIRLPDSLSVTPLQASACFGWADAIKELLKAKADPHLLGEKVAGRDGIKQLTALQILTTLRPSATLDVEREQIVAIRALAAVSSLHQLSTALWMHCVTPYPTVATIKALVALKADPNHTQLGAVGKTPCTCTTRFLTVKHTPSTDDVACFEALCDAPSGYGSVQTRFLGNALTRVSPKLALRLVELYGHAGTAQPGQLNRFCLEFNSRVDIVRSLYARHGHTLGLAATPQFCQLVIGAAGRCADPRGLFAEFAKVNALGHISDIHAKLLFTAAVKSTGVVPVDPHTGRISYRRVMGNAAAVEALIAMKVDLSKLTFNGTGLTCWTEACLQAKGADILPVLAKHNLHATAGVFSPLPPALLHYPGTSRVMTRLLGSGFLLSAPESVLTSVPLDLKSIEVVVDQMTKPGARILPTFHDGRNYTLEDTIVHEDWQKCTRHLLIRKSASSRSVQQIGFHLAHFAVGRMSGMHKLATFARNETEETFHKVMALVGKTDMKLRRQVRCAKVFFKAACLGKLRHGVPRDVAFKIAVEMLGRPIGTTLRNKRLDEIVPVAGPPLLLECRSGGMDTPLLTAVRYDNLPLAKTLLGLGANVHAFNRHLWGINEQLAARNIHQEAPKHAAMRAWVSSLMSSRCCCAKGCFHVGDVIRMRREENLRSDPAVHLDCLRDIERKSRRWGGLKSCSVVGLNCVELAVEGDDFTLAAEMARLGATVTISSLRAAIQAADVEAVQAFVATGMSLNVGRPAPAEKALISASTQPDFQPARKKLLRTLLASGAQVLPRYMTDTRLSPAVRSIAEEALKKQKPSRSRKKRKAATHVAPQ